LIAHVRVALATIVALATTGCGWHPVRVTMDDFEGMGTVHGTWQFGRPMWMVMPVPSFDHAVRITDLTFETVSGGGTITRTDPQLLVLSAGPYRGLTLAYYLDKQGGQLVPFDKLTIEPGVHRELQLVALLNSPTPGCHEARLVLTVKAGDSRRTFRPRYYVGLDTGLSKGQGEHHCDATPS